MQIVLVFIGYAAGICLACVIFRPNKNWQEGYDAAKEMYSDWNKGFNVGYDAAAEHYQDYKQGFNDGWDAHKRYAETEGVNDSQREDAEEGC